MTRKKKETHYRCKVNKYQEPHNFPNCLFLISYTICSHLNYVELHHSLMVDEYFLLFCKNLNEKPRLFYRVLTMNHLMSFCYRYYCGQIMIMITVCIVKGHFIVHGCMDECLIIFLIRTQKKATLQKQKKKCLLNSEVGQVDLELILFYNNFYPL